MVLSHNWILDISFLEHFKYLFCNYNCESKKIINTSSIGKIGNNYSEWDTLIKGVPQGSILVLVLFKVFINDIFHFVQDSTI
jgi:hypothetical protein